MKFAARLAACFLVGLIGAIVFRFWPDAFGFIALVATIWFVVWLYRKGDSVPTSEVPDYVPEDWGG